jgi:hypothetical protein
MLSYIKIKGDQNDSKGGFFKTKFICLFVTKNVYEMYFRGREVIAKAYEHLGKKQGSSSGTLFS